MHAIIAMLQQWPAELLMMLEALFCCLSMAIIAGFWGEIGLAAYMAVAIVASNIEVMKGAFLTFFSTPMALGNVLYGSVAIGIGIATELYGAQQARKYVNLGFLIMLLFATFMVFTVGYTPLSPDMVDTDIRYLATSHEYMTFLLLPSVSIAVSSVISFSISSYAEVLLILLLKKAWGKNKYNMLRLILADNLAVCLDLFIMNYLTWIVFSGGDMPLKTLFFVYILGSFVVRIAMGFIAYPTLCLCKAIQKKCKSL